MKKRSVWEEWPDLELVVIYEQALNLLKKKSRPATGVAGGFFTAARKVYVKFQMIISRISFQLFPISVTTVGSKPQCIMHWAQRSSLPTPYLLQSVFSIISR